MNRSLAVISVVLALGIIGGLVYIVMTPDVQAPTTSPTTNTGLNPATSDFLYVNASGDTVRVELPFPHAVVGKEFSVLGQARGCEFAAGGEQPRRVAARGQGEGGVGEPVAGFAQPGDHVTPSTSRGSRSATGR